MNTTMDWHYVEKEYTDYADDIEAVSIHYVWTPIGGCPDWENQRITRYMPHVKLSIQRRYPAPGRTTSSEAAAPNQRPLRKKTLKLPLQIEDPAGGPLTNRYLLHYYFEVFQDGHRHYSSLHTEEIITDPSSRTADQEESAESQDSQEVRSLHSISPSSSKIKERV
jgi:hypothetical protein